MSLRQTPPQYHRLLGQKDIRRLARARRLWQGAFLGMMVSAILAIIALGGLFAQSRLALTDFLYVPAPISGNVVIVAMDDQSLGAYGRTVAQWPRQLHADLVTTLAKAGARVVAFDVIFAESTADDVAFATAIREARSSNSRTRTILAFFGQDPAFENIPNGPFTYRSSLQPSLTLTAAVDILGHVNVVADQDSKIRHLPLMIQAAEETRYSLSMAAYLAYLRIPANAIGQVVKAIPGAINITRDRVVPVDSAYRAIIPYFGIPDAFPTYSYRAVLAGEVDLGMFKDKIVLVGLKDASGSTDRYLVPISPTGQLMSGVEVHANMIEALIQNRFLTSQNLVSELLFSVFIALILGIVLSQIRWYTSIVVTTASALVLIVVASVIFSASRFIISLLLPFLALMLSLIGAFISAIRIEAGRRWQAQQLLNSSTRLIEGRLKLAEAIHYIVDDLAIQIGLPRSAIWLLHDSDNQFLPQRLSAEYWSPSHLPPDNATTTNARIVLDSEQIMVGPGVLLAPMIFQRQPLGVIGVLTRSEHYFTRDEILFLNRYVQQFAPALANARQITRQLEQKDLLEVILRSTPNPLMVLDSDSTLLRANPSALMLLGLDFVPLKALSVSALMLRLGISAEIVPEIVNSVNHTQPFQREIAIGKQTFVLQGSPLRVAQNGWVIVLNDISTLKELDAFKTQMIRMASHDIKNPMGVILGYTELLLEDARDDQVRMITVIRETAQQTLDLTRDILSLERVRAARLDLTLFDIAGLLRSIVNRFASQAAEKSQSLTFEAIGGEEIVLRGDMGQLREALANLVENAIKYTPQGGQIRVRVESLGEKIKVSVADSGVGIPQSAMARLFQPFYRVRTRATANILGTGLGLHLARMVFETHQGKITVESVEGQGTTFFVELPILKEEVTADDLETPGK